MARPESVEQYLEGLAAPQRAAAEELRAAIRAVAPDATEAISYEIPTFRVGGRVLVSYAAYRGHCSLYPASLAVRQALGDELALHLSGKATICFDLATPLPLDLVAQVVQVRLEEVGAPRPGRRRGTQPGA